MSMSERVPFASGGTRIFFLGSTRNVYFLAPGDSARAFKSTAAVAGGACPFRRIKRTLNLVAACRVTANTIILPQPRLRKSLVLTWAKKMEFYSLGI